MFRSARYSIASARSKKLPCSYDVLMKTTEDLVQICQWVARQLHRVSERKLFGIYKIEMLLPALEENLR